MAQSNWVSGDNEDEDSNIINFGTILMFDSEEDQTAAMQDFFFCIIEEGGYLYIVWADFGAILCARWCSDKPMGGCQAYLWGSKNEINQHDWACLPLLPCPLESPQHKSKWHQFPTSTNCTFHTLNYFCLEYCQGRWGYNHQIGWHLPGAYWY